MPDRTGRPGRRAQWCSKGCRQAAWRARTAAGRAARAAAELSGRIAGAGYSDVQAAARVLGEAVIAMCQDGDMGDMAVIEGALMSGHRWEGDVAGAARRLAAAATRVADMADAHAAHVADYRRAAAVIRRAPARHPGGDDSPAAPPGGIVATTAAQAPATKPAATISASGISRVLARAGFTRAEKVPGGRGGVLSPITDGFKVWSQGSGHVLVDHLPADAEDRHTHLAAMAAALTAAGYAVASAGGRGDLDVTLSPSGPAEAASPAAPAPVGEVVVDGVDVDGLFDAVEDVLDVRDVPGIGQHVLQGVPGTSFAGALDMLAAAHATASGDGPLDGLAAAAAAVVRARPPHLPARADAAITRLAAALPSEGQ
ncbi:hypothetical protein [Actinomadura formosensis]|uniref:hypothetical protein n=1 Tax=Actinomadura formosensis TaxID=60706 RepID=UPI00082FB9BE|nr:hypothetical protein [Actinomadura formosensis]